MSDNTHKGWKFPEGVDIPKGGWYRSKEGDTESWAFNQHVVLDVAHQIGLNGIETEIVHVGTGLNDVPYVAVRAEVDVEGRPPVSAIGSIDETGNSLEDMVATAETKAVTRAFKRSIGITESVEYEGSDDETTKTRQGGKIEHGPDGGVDVTPPDDDDDNSDFGF